MKWPIGILTHLLPHAGRWNCIRTAPYHPAIHNFGNIGAGGWLHSKVARFATDMIDTHAYDGRNVRREVAAELAQRFPGGRVVDVGCGVGTLTRELQATGVFNLTAVDTSMQMIDEASAQVEGVDFRCLNGADVAERMAVDVAISSMVLHELPPKAHEELVGAMIDATAARKGEVWLMDISPSYHPKWIMQVGEPYIVEYLSTIETTLARVASGKGLTLSSDELIPGHVRRWILAAAEETVDEELIPTVA